MPLPHPLFTGFDCDIDSYSLPEKFTFPFYYQPHPLCILAAKQLQQHLTQQQQWQHDFGVDNNPDGCGKMFGVLLAKSPSGEIGYFAAFSGKIADQNHLPHFVPPVFDMLAKESFFRDEQAQITKLNQAVSKLQANPKLAEIKQALKQQQSDYSHAEQQQRSAIISARAQRKTLREQGKLNLSEQALSILLIGLSKESVDEKNALKLLKQTWQSKIDALESQLYQLTSEIDALKQQRKRLSNQLQNRLFEQYRFLNISGEQCSLKTIFANTSSPTPPAGAGECAAPKLLHYAFKHSFKPLAMAEFWWGASPKSEIRQHTQFYPSCNSKCKPILSYMLQGMAVDDNPLEQNWAEDKPLHIVYQDEAIVVVNKPSGLLSVPGKTITDSAYTRIQQLFPDVEGPFIIHRLDMATSGLLVFALTKRANKSLQKQFIARSVSKRYVALLDGEINQSSGEINLPMRGDPDDRPRQLVCFEHGKPALTHWEKIATQNGKSKLYLYPQTGRTHQLRIHCAHHLGLNIPMVGDTLYGQKAERLHLHAEQLQLDHPYTHQRMTFQVDAEF